MHYVVRETLRVDARCIPGPSLPRAAPAEQSFLLEVGQKLDGKERVAVSFHVHEICQVTDVLSRGMQRITNELRKVGAPQRSQHHFRDVRTSSAQLSQCDCQRMDA